MESATQEKCFLRSFAQQLQAIMPQGAEKVLKKLQLLIRPGWDQQTTEAVILQASYFKPLPTNFPDILCDIIDFAFDYGFNQAQFNELFIDYEKFRNLGRFFFENIISTPSISEIKQLHMLASEIQSMNPQYNVNELINEFVYVQSEFCTCAIKYASSNNIFSWTEKVRKNPTSCLTAERIAYVWRVMEMTSSHKVRDIQVLTVMMMYRSKKGQLAQVNTGEGKTIIIAMLAALLCLDGHQVDIVTTSPELAVPQSQQLEDFYRLLGLTSSNIDKGNKSAAYTCNVVYGSINEFVGDVLHDEFLKEGTRMSKKYDIVIVDEADSLLVDGINNMTRLSSPMPGMNTLLPILITIWSLLVEDDKFNGGNGDQFKKLMSEMETFLEGGDIIETKIRNQILSGILKVPKHLLDFILNHQLKVWVQSAVTARFRLQKDREYVIEDREVKIVDLHNSGIVFKNMKWNDGIHQFLQIKNNVPLTSEDLVTNYLGNPTFFLKYKKIYGLTGTLGCSETKKFLESTYGTETKIVPPFKTKVHTKLQPIVVESKNEWYKMIIDSCRVKLKYGRAVLIIAESIDETEKIKHNFFLDGFSNIRMYQTEKHSEVCKHLVEPGQVIITTNICGRGVNIFPSSKVIGGLHICLTFLPENSRVEEQNIGRTSRSGNPGTSQMILLGSGKLENIKTQRDSFNAGRIEVMSKDIDRTKIKAEVFNRFCIFLNKVENAIKNQTAIEEFAVSQTYFSQLQPDQFCGAIKEKFSIWLKTNESRYDSNPSELLMEFYKFERSIKSTFASKSRVTENIFFFIISGIKCLQTEDYDAAIEQFDQAISIDGNFSAFAYLNRAVACMAKNEHKKAFSDLEKSRNEISGLIKDMINTGRLGAKLSKELQFKFDRQIELLTETSKSIELVTKNKGKSQKKEVDLVFKKWLDNLPPECKADAIELLLRGWLGSVEVKLRKIGFMNTFSNYCYSLVSRADKNDPPNYFEQTGSSSFRRSRSRFSDMKY